jgi:hypothetical protein
MDTEVGHNSVDGSGSSAAWRSHEVVNAMPLLMAHVASAAAVQYVAGSAGAPAADNNNSSSYSTPVTLAAWARPLQTLLHNMVAHPVSAGMRWVQSCWIALEMKALQQCSAVQCFGCDES